MLRRNSLPVGRHKAETIKSAEKLLKNIRMLKSSNRKAAK